MKIYRAFMRAHSKPEPAGYMDHTLEGFSKDELQAMVLTATAKGWWVTSTDTYEVDEATGAKYRAVRALYQR